METKDRETILVTGGAGFIGSHLVERLLKDGYRVICLDNFNNYYDPRIKEENVKTVHSNPEYILIRGDILDTSVLETLFSDYPISKIVHLAAFAGVRASLLNPGDYVDVDIKGTLNLLEMARKNRVKQFIFGSSSSVYGEESTIPFREDELILKPISPYSASKLAGEMFCETYSKLYQLPITILRFFTVYGPRQRPEMAIHLFARLMKRGKPIPLFGKGDRVRDFTYVDDIVAGVISALGHSASFEIFNLGNSRTISLSRVIEVLSKEIGKDPIIHEKPIQLGDVSATHADISKAKNFLGWTPRVSFEEGVRRFIKWHDEKEEFLNSLLLD